jgi:hypothetical protein
MHVCVWCACTAAIAKYGKGQSTDDLALAVELLFERNLLPRLNPMATLVSNDFRTERLYTEEVDLVLKQHQVSRRLSGTQQPPGLWRVHQCTDAQLLVATCQEYVCVRMFE